MNRCLSALLVLYSFGCGDDDVCVSGTAAPCTSAAGCEGTQVCNDFGTGFGPCICDRPLLDGDVDSSADAGVDADVPAELKAFPTAYGAGAYATGGRGGTVVAVTRLDDARDGGEPVDGTLRYALTRPFPRMIVFRVSGTIVVGDTTGDGAIDSTSTYPGMIAMESAEFSNFTVAGQTAPEGGITIRGHLYTDKVSNMVWRYVRFRKNPESEFDAMDINDAQNIVLDHLSVAYGTDECASIAHGSGTAPETDYSVQYNLFGDSKTGSIMQIEGDGRASIHNNFYSRITHRFPNLGGDGHFDVINNLVHNWAFRLVNVHNTITLNHINNAVVDGLRTRQAGDYTRIGNKVHMGTEGILDSRIYTSGNFISGLLTDPDADNWPSWSVFVGGNGYSEDDAVPTEMQASEPFDVIAPAAPLRTAAQIMAELPDEVGAFRTLSETGAIVVYRDELDEQFIADFRGGDGPNYSFRVENFTYPTIPSNAPYADGDGDGMPDVWESMNGFDPAVADDAGDADGDGYTNLEEFLNEVDAR